MFFRALDRIASRQNALITTRQLRVDAGLTNRQISRYCAKGAIRRIRRGVYRVAGAPHTWTQTVHAAVLAGGPNAVASHATAAVLWGFKHCSQDDCGLHLTARHYVRLSGIIAHTARLDRRDVTVCRGVPVTTAERTLLDLAATMPLEKLGKCLDDLLRRDVIHLKRLRSMVAAACARGGRRRRVPLQTLLAERSGDYKPGGSDWERDMDALWDSLRLEAGVRQHRVQVNGHTYIIDRAIPGLKIGVEFNGYEYHHHRSDTDRDACRAAALSAAGWHMIAVTAGVRPQSMRDAVQRVIDDRRRWLAGQPSPEAPPAQAAPPQEEPGPSMDRRPGLGLGPGNGPGYGPGNGPEGVDVAASARGQPRR